MSRNPPLPTVVFAVLCEDVREEVNRKHSLMGVYSGNILVPQFPAHLRLALYADLNLPGRGEYALSLRANYDGKEQFNLKAQIKSEKLGSSALVLPSFVLKVPDEGDFVLDYSFDGGEWQQLMKKHVSVGEIPSLQSRPG